jgi:hypothetical protein
MILLDNGEALQLNGLMVKWLELREFPRNIKNKVGDI